MGEMPFAAATVAPPSGAPALALDVTKTATVAAPSATVSKTNGELCGIGDWNPPMERYALPGKGGRQIRTMFLKIGGTVVEEEVARDEKTMAYKDAILDCLLPVEGKKSTLLVALGGAGSKLTWTDNCKAKCAPDAKVEEVLGGIDEDGPKGIIEMGG